MAIFRLEYIKNSLAIAFIFSFGCQERSYATIAKSREPQYQPNASATAPMASAPTPPSELPPPAAELPPKTPLIAFPPNYSLQIPNHGSALVLVPIHAIGPKPLVIAAHGAGGRPELQCERWRPILQERAFVLCIRGYALGLSDSNNPPQNFFYPTHHALARELENALSALGRVFGENVDMRDPVFIGFSQGAVMGAMILPEHSAHIARALLNEGGSGEYAEWSIPVARRFFERGGRRVLLACGRPSCDAYAQKTAGHLKKAGLLTLVHHAKGAGHDESAILNKGLANAFEWLIEDDPRFQNDNLH